MVTRSELDEAILDEAGVCLKCGEVVPFEGLRTFGLCEACGEYDSVVPAELVERIAGLIEEEE